MEIRLTRISHLVQWHVEWKCDQAEREFKAIMEKHPQRESSENRKRREQSAREWIYFETIRRRKIDDQRGSLIDMTLWGRVASPGCECLVWGAKEIANEAWNEAMRSFNGVCPIASDWGDFVLSRVEEAGEGALEEIRVAMSAVSPKPDSIDLTEGAKDHFPLSQQDIVRKRIADAVDEAKETVRAHMGAPGPAAKDAQMKAAERCYESRQEIVAEQKKESSEEQSKEGLGSTTGATGQLSAASTAKMVEGLEIS